MKSMYQTQMQNSQATYQTALQNPQNTMNQTNSQAFEEIIVAVVATSLIVLFMMLYTVRERTKEIGTLKAIGFSNTSVMSQFMLEGVLLSLLAGVVGIAIGIFAAPVLSSMLLPAVKPFSNNLGMGIGTLAINTTPATNAAATAVTVSPQLVLISFAAAVLLGAVGSLYPAWRAARTRPAEAMRYE